MKTASGEVEVKLKCYGIFFLLLIHSRQTTKWQVKLEIVRFYLLIKGEKKIAEWEKRAFSTNIIRNIRTGFSSQDKTVDLLIDRWTQRDPNAKLECLYQMFV